MKTRTGKSLEHLNNVQLSPENQAVWADIEKFTEDWIKMTHRRNARPKIYAGDVFITLCAAILVGIIAYQLATYKQFQTGTLTVYDANLNPKYTFQGEFEYKGDNTWYDNKTQTSYTFENAIFESSK